MVTKQNALMLSCILFVTHLIVSLINF